MLAHATDAVITMRLICGRCSHQHCRLVARYISASVCLFFYELDSNLEDKEWNEIQRLGLLRPEERKCLAQIRSPDVVLNSQVLLHWAADVASLGHAQAVKDEKAPPNMRKSILDKLSDCGRLQTQIADTMQLPFPFAYFHLLNAMIVVNLAFWSYGFGMTHSPLMSFVYVCSALIFMGMMELASELADPFGNDDVDFPVGVWAANLVERLALLVEYDFPGCNNGWEEILADEAPMPAGQRRIECLHFGDHDQDEHHAKQYSVSSDSDSSEDTHIATGTAQGGSSRKLKYIAMTEAA